MKKYYGTCYMNLEKFYNGEGENLIKLDYYQSKNSKFGIEVVKTVNSSNIIEKESKRINEITNDENETDRILEILRQNKVTPVVADDIIYDIIKQGRIKTQM